MEKYRIRYPSGRIIGPFQVNEIKEIQSKGYLNGDEEVQVYPTGSWKSIDEYSFYNTDAPEGTFILDLSRIRSKNQSRNIDDLSLDEIPADSEKENIQTIIIQEETEIISVENNKVEVQVNAEHMSSQSLRPEGSPKAAKELEEVSHDKTVINPKAQLELKKLQEKMKKAEEDEKNQKLKEDEEKRRKEIEKEIEKKEIESLDGATQVVKLDKISDSLLSRANEEEKEILEIEKKIKAKKKQEEKVDSPDEQDDEEEREKSKKKKIVFLMASLIILYVVLFPDKKESNPQFKFLAPQISFPLPFDKSDKKSAQINFEKGKELFVKGTYPDIVKSGLALKISYENDIENHEVLSLLLRSYAEQLFYSKEKLSDAQIIFNIIQSKRPYLLKNPNGAIGINLFYSAMEKHQAAVDMTAKYLKLNPQNITEDLFATYLKSLIRVGKLELANQIFTALNKAPNKTSYTYDALIEYLQLNQDIDQAEKYLEEAVKKFPYLVKFQLKKAESLIQKNNFKEATQYLRNAENLNLENNDKNRAKFLELTGFLLAAQNKVKEATVFLEKSLQIEDSESLRNKLSQLKTTEGVLTKTDKLIAESKAIKFLNLSKEFFSQNNFSLALSNVAKATDQLEGHIPSELFLAKVQMKLGQAEIAIKTLENLLKKYPDNVTISFALIEAYIDTYKFFDARNRISVISGLDIKNSWQFASLNAKLNKKMGNTLQAITWLKNAINLNPLNDEDIYSLAEIFIKRNNFDSAQLLLTKCIELDPTNPDYRIAYAKIIYERQDDQAAIGYLLTLLDEFGESPRVLGEIAILYYRAGKVKDFLAFKERISKLPVKDKYLFDFLIKAALLDERYDEIPRLVEELLQIDPGDLESMMTAGRVLFENGKLVEAANWFKRVQDKLTTYPKVQYYIAKIKMLAGEIDDKLDEKGARIKDGSGNEILGALSLVQKDLKENGDSDIALVLLGEIYVQKGDFAEAETAFKRAQKINPKSYEALVGLADISTKRNNFDLALDLYQKAMSQKGDEPIIHKKIGDVYRLLGQGSLAIESYKMYLEMNPDAPDKGQIESFINIMQ
jgi:tetratricopeptide (TPR) repeat protein